MGIKGYDLIRSICPKQTDRKTSFQGQDNFYAALISPLKGKEALPDERPAFGKAAQGMRQVVRKRRQDGIRLNDRLVGGCFFSLCPGDFGRRQDTHGVQK